MTKDFDDSEIQAALNGCAMEPTRRIQFIQSFAGIVAARIDTGVIEYASANLVDICGLNAQSTLGSTVGDILGRELWHAMNNRAAQKSYAKRRVTIGETGDEEHRCTVFGFRSGDHHVLELEPLGSDYAETQTPHDVLVTLVEEIEEETFIQDMLEKLVRLLRMMTGFDRVMAYQFDPDQNGAVVAEDRSSTLEPYLGLRFPNWDIPKQAREVMRAIPLRLIHDLRTDPVPILQNDQDADPLDIGLAHSRGVPDVHKHYMTNMKVGASMTLSIVVENQLWGMIAFHHKHARFVSENLRTILEEFAHFLNSKITALQHRDLLILVDRVEAVKGAILQEVEDDKDLVQSFDKIGPILLDVFDAQGVASLAGSQSFQTGRVPGQAVLDKLLHVGNNRPNQVVTFDDLSRRFPELSSDLNGLAGALVATTSKNRAIGIFREERTQTFQWAGKPDKSIRVDKDAVPHLEPRASFAAYVEEVRGTCAPWTDQDFQFARRIWPIVTSAERQVLMNTVNRQQGLMIEELNHRVRNILALVRAVSGQARRRYGSLNSYAKALEARIQALAAAHDIGQGKGLEAVSIRSIVAGEIEPYDNNEAPKVTVNGPDHHVVPEVAPIFALIIHELVTNAAKYGALSQDKGTVDITFFDETDAMRMTWIERGGPTVSEPENVGFGSVLIEHAVPHELDGSAQIDFHPNGVQASITLPKTVFRETTTTNAVLDTLPNLVTAPPASKIDAVGSVLLVEDNFVIAREVMDQVLEYGFEEVKVCSNVADAIEFLQDVTPTLAILDVNLGNGRTSQPVAEALEAIDVPYIFATGYGDVPLAEGTAGAAATLTKPVSTEALSSAISRVLSSILP